MMVPVWVIAWDAILAIPKSVTLAEAVLMNHDVGRLDVAMNDSLLVGVVERGGDLPQNAEQRIFVGSLCRSQHIFEGRAIDELHEDVGQAVLFENVVNGHDSGVRKDSGGLGFAKESLTEAFAFRFLGEIVEPDALDGDDPADGGVLGLVDNAHGTASQFAQNQITPDLFHDVYPILTQASRF